MDVLYVGGLTIQNHPTLVGPFSARLTTIHVYADVYMYIYMIPLQQPSPSRKQQMTRSSGNYRYLNRHQCSRGGGGARERLVFSINNPRLLLTQPLLHIIPQPE